MVEDDDEIDAAEPEQRKVGRSGASGPGLPNDAERRRAAAYLDLWERQVTLTASRHRFPPLPSECETWKTR